MSLFRQDALLQQQQKFYGAILLARPLSFSFLTGFFALVVVAIGLFFLCFGFSRKEVVSGVLLPEQGLIRVYTPQAGMLVERKVKNGQQVAQGDVLFILSGERASSSKGDTQQAIGQSLSSRMGKLRRELDQQTGLAQQQQVALQRRKAELQGQVEQIGQEIALQQKRLQLAEQAARRFDDLKKSNFVSQAQVQDKEAEVLEHQARLRTLERNRAVIALDLGGVAAELQAQPLKAGREMLALERAMEEIEQSIVQNEAARQIVIRSPRAGMVTTAIGEPGQLLNPNQVLASVIPVNGKLAAELYAPSRSVGFIKPGTRVLIRYQAFPYQKFGQYAGTVVEVASHAVIPGELLIPLARDMGATDPLYRLKVELDQNRIQAYGRSEPLKSGMQLEASLVLEQRKLYEWVMEPLYSVTGRI